MRKISGCILVDSPCTVARESPSTVAHLIDPSTRRWKEDRVKEWFNHEEAMLILGIPLHENAGNDTWGWGLTKNFSFIVKSAYHMVMSNKIGLSSSSSTNRLGETLSKIRRCKLHPRINLFMWKILHAFIPCKAVLAPRLKIHNDLKCVICHDTDSLLHAFYYCCDASVEWISMDLKPPSFLQSDDSFIDWLMLNCQQNELALTAKLCTLIWKLWYARCLLQQKKASCYRWGCELAQSFLDSSSLAPVSNERSRYGEDHDQGGTRDVAIIHVDASVGSEGRTGCAAVIKDADSRVTAVAVKGMNGLFTPNAAEAMAVELGVNLANRMGVDKALVKSDCMQVVKFLNGCNEPGDINVYVARTLSNLLKKSSRFQSLAFKYIPRSDNVGSHLLANMGRNGHDCGEWIGNVPNHLVNVCD